MGKIVLHAFTLFLEKGAAVLRTSATFRAEFSILYLLQSQAGAFAKLKRPGKGCRQHEDR